MHVDIKCPKCGTEYELESEKIPPAGLKVKCTHCGFIFKAERPQEQVKKTMLMYASPVPSAPVPSAPPVPVPVAPAWLIRKPDGMQFGFNDLAALQRLVSEGRVVETDEISRQGEGWKRIAEIPEFAGFFIARSIAPVVSAPYPSVVPQPAPVPPPVPHPAAPLIQTQEILVKPPVQHEPIPFIVPSTPPAPAPSTPPVAYAPPPAAAPVPPAPPAFIPAPPAVISTPPADATPTLPPGIRRSAVADDDRILNAIPRGEPAPAPAVVPVPQPVTAPAKAAAAPAAPAHHDEAHAAAEAHFHRPLTADDFENVDAYGRPKRSMGLIIGLIVGVIALLAGASVALYFLAPATFASVFGTEPVLTKAQEADYLEALKALDTEDTPGFTAAVERLSQFRSDSKDKENAPKVNAKAVAALAQAHMAWGEPLRDEALDMKAVLDEIVIHDPTSAVARKINDEMDVKMREAVKHLDESLDIVRAVIRQSPESMEANIALADYYRIQASNEPGAVAKVKEYIATAEKDKRAKDFPYFSLVKGGGLLRSDANADEGIKLLKKSLELNPGLVRAHYVLARAYLASKKPAEAKAELEAMLKQAPGNTIALGLIATIDKAAAGAEKKEPFEEKKEEPAKEPEKKAEPKEEPVKEKPVEAKKEAAKEKPPAEPKKEAPPKEEKKAAKEGGDEGGGAKNAAAYEPALKQAKRLREAGKTKQAIDFFQKAADADGTKADPHAGLGWCYVEMEKFDQAIAEFKKALGLKGPKCEALSGLGESYKYKKNKQEAINHYQKYLQECPNGPDAPVARNAINSMR